MPPLPPILAPRRLGLLCLGLLCLAAFAAACAPAPLAPASQRTPRATSTSSTVQPTIVHLPTDQPVVLTPTTTSGETGAGRAPSDCAGLDATLSQVVASARPVERARQLLVPVKDGEKVQVVLTLQGPEIAFLARFDVEVGTVSGTTVQAYAPLARLCELVRTDEVLRIDLPAQAVTQ